MRPPHYHEAYDETSLWASRFGALLFDELELRAGVRGLDVGCATGFPLLELAQMHGPSSPWIGVDVWDEALARARRKIEILGIRNARVEHADAAALPFPEESFDLVVSNLGLNNFEDPPAALREVARVLTPGGRVAMTTNVTGHMHEFYALYREVLSALGLGELRAALDEQEQHRGSVASIAATMAEAGLPMTRSATRTFRLRYLDGTAMLRHSLVQWFLDGWRAVAGSANERTVFAEIEKRLNERAPLAFTVEAVYVEGTKG